MRCPHCRGEIPQASRFCGVCGRNVTIPPTEASRPVRPSGQESSTSLFELPVSRGARAARVFVVLALDLLLAGAGAAMILSYLDERRAVAAEPGARPDAGPVGSVEALRPQPIDEDEGGAETAVDEETASASPSTVEGETDDLPRSKTSSAAGEKSSARDDRKSGGSATKTSGKRSTTEDDGDDDEDRQSTREDTRPAEPSSDEAAEPDGDEGDEAASDTTPVDPYDDPAVEPESELDEAGPDDVQRLAGRISLLVGQHQAQLQRCYERASKLTTPTDPLVGRIEVRFTVTAEGRAESVRALRNDTGSGQLEDCLVGLVESWTFPAASREPVDFLWPFVFKAPE